MKNQKGKVISNERVSGEYYLMTMKCPELAKISLEGQIVHVKCGEHSDAYLRRPFCIYRFNLDNETVELLYLVKGKGTRIMTEFKVGDTVDMLGPGGNHYELDADAPAIAVISRGVGIAAIVALAEKARIQGKEVLAVLSGKTKDAIVANDVLKDIGCKVFVVTDDDDSSAVDNVKAILSENIEALSIKQLFTCGSNRINKLAKELARQYDISAFASFEEHMACGLGVCKGCVHKTIDGQKTVCKDGPIFNLEEVLLDE